MFSRLFGGARGRASTTYSLTLRDVVWAMGSVCALNRKPFDPELLAQQFPPPHTSDSLIAAARALGFRIQRQLAALDADRKSVV